MRAALIALALGALLLEGCPDRRGAGGAPLDAAPEVAIDGEHLYRSGVAWETGQGVSPDPARAAAHYRRACEEAEHLRACNNLGVLLHEGRGLAADAAAAADLFARACEGGVADACFNLGMAFAEGAGRPARPARARALFERACAGRHVDACINAAVMALRPPGDAPAQPKVAAALLARACELGDAQGCHDARVIYGLACEAGDAEACAARQRLPPPEEAPASDATRSPGSPSTPTAR